jgi:hypothetical protein
MPRPEKPVPGDGPLADLARALRLLRDRTGRTYRELAPVANYSAAQLAAAARGTSCPTRPLVLAYARACAASPPEVAKLRALRAKADAARRHASSNRHQGAVPDQPLTVRQAEPMWEREADAVSESVVAYCEEPQPQQAYTAAQYIRQLRALRAWAGNPGHKEIARRGGNRLLAASSMYDALSPARTTLPPLETVTAIVRACAPGSIRDWVATWQVISLRAFEDANPMPPRGDATLRPRLRVIDGQRHSLRASNPALQPRPTMTRP